MSHQKTEEDLRKARENEYRETLSKTYLHDNGSYGRDLEIRDVTDKVIDHFLAFGFKTES